MLRGIPHNRCHRPAWPGDPVLRGGAAGAEGLRRTGCPGQAGHDSGMGGARCASL